MDLSQTIADLERMAGRFREAANKLRALQDGSFVEVTALPSLAAASDVVASGAAASRKTGQATQRKGQATQTKPNSDAKPKRFVSPETRARLAEAMRARHAARKAAASE